MKMRFAAYAGASTALAAGVVVRAFHQRANFYSAAVYLSQSNACLMILTNLVLLCVGGLMFGLQRLFYGPLRPIEIEQLYEKSWFAITETCLAMTIFREEVGGWFMVMFVSLLAGKVWGWIGEGRVEVLEQQPPANPRLFHARLSFSLFLSLAFDLYMLNYCVNTVLQMARPNMMVMFAFEFAVLTISSISTAFRYAISLIEAAVIRTQTRAKIEEKRAEIRERRAELLRDSESDRTPPEELPSEDDIDETDIDVPGWEEKGRWVFYLELATDFFKLVVYLSFFMILLTFYGLPIHIMRDVFLTLRSFTKRIADYARYRSATKDMNERYPDATVEEVNREEVCIICREEMRPWQQPGEVPARAAGQAQRNRTTSDQRWRPKKLPCGHILHFGCLRSWLERQQVCPTCRRPVLVSNRTTSGQGNQPGQNVANQAPQFPAGPQGQNPAGAAVQQRGRIFNFGPFRLGWTVGQVPNLQELERRLQNGQQPAVQPDQAGLGLNFGFGRPGLPAQNPNNGQPGVQTASRPRGNMDAQLLDIENQIMQQIGELRLASEQLHHVRLLRAELERLRINSIAVSAGLAPLIQHPGVLPPGQQPLPQFLPNQYSAQPAQVQVHRSTPRIPAMTAGDANLPSGLSLPPGWTLLPLQQDPLDSGVSNATMAEPIRRSISTPATRAATGNSNAVPVPGFNLPAPQAFPPNSVTPTRGQISPSGATAIVPPGQRDPVSQQNLPRPITPTHLIDRNRLRPATGGSVPTPTQPTQTRSDSLPSSVTGDAQQASSIPNWGTSEPSNIQHPNLNDNLTTSDTAPTMPQENFKEAAGEVPSRNSELREDGEKTDKGKGKAKAATVEDFVEDLD